MAEEQPKRRKHSRVGVKLKCNVKLLDGSSKVLSGTAGNVSYRGLFFRPEEMINVSYGGECIVSLFLGDEAVNPVIKATAKIIHKGDQGLGLEFTDLSLDSFEHLKNLLVYSSDDPDKIEDEIDKSD